MSYEVFARKYRPQTFDDLVGQSHVAQTLKNAIQQRRLAHAYLFVGPRGVGKTSIARILAKALNCVHGPTITPCSKCDLCIEIAGGNSFNVMEYDAASNTQVDKIRELILENVNRAAWGNAKYKIYIIDEVHMLSTSSFNALLKTLEEPPPHVIFMFATTEVQKMPLTIISRCQRFDLHRIAAPLIAQHLQFIAGKEKIALAGAAANAIARGADGGLRDAESMLDQLVAFCGDAIEEADVLNVFGLTGEQTVRDFTQKILERATSDALSVLHEQCEAGKDMMKLMSDLIAYLRDLLVFKVNPAGTREDVDAERLSSFTSQGELLETARLLEMLEQFAEAETRMKWAPNKKLHFEVAVIKAIQTLGQATLDEVLENLSALRDGKPTAPRVAEGSARVPRAATGVSPAASKKSPPRDAKESEPDARATSEISIDAPSVWQAVVTQARKQRPLIRTWMESAHVIGTDGRNFVIGFPPSQSGIKDSLEMPKNRSFIEALLKEAAGRDLGLKATVQDGLAEKHPETPAEPMAAKSEGEPFREEPLIREALDMFKGKIRT